MNDGSMFAELAHFGDQARFDECRTVYLLTPDANYRLRTFALLHVDATDPLVQNTFADDEEYTPKRAESGLQGWIDCYEKSVLKAHLFCGGVGAPRDINGNNKLQEAYELGKSITL